MQINIKAFQTQQKMGPNKAGNKLVFFSNNKDYIMGADTNILSIL